MTDNEKENSVKKNQEQSTNNNENQNQLYINEKQALLINDSQDRYCEYCNQKCHEQILKFSDNIMKFITISPNVTYYFKFLQFVIVILLFDFIFYGIITHYVILNNLTTFHCFLNKCLKESNFEEVYQSQRHRIMFSINLGVLIMFKYLWLFYIRNLNRKLDESENTPSDYTIYLRGIDPKKSSQQIAQDLEEYFKKWDAEVVRINLIYDIDPILKSIKKYTIAKKQQVDIESKIKDYQTEEKISHKKLKKYQKKLKKSNIKLQKSERDLKDFLDLQFKKQTKFLGKAYVTFQTQTQLRKVVKAHRFMIFQYRINIGKYNIQRAYEPHDIIWENLGQKTSTRYLLRGVTIIAGLIIFALSFCIALSFRILQKGVKLNDPYAQYVFAFLVVLSLGTFLKIFQTILEKLTLKERHRTITHYKISLGLKSVYSFFVNICCVLLGVNLIIHGTSEKFLYGTKGVVSSTQLILNFIVFGDFIIQLMDLLLTQRMYHQKRHIERVKKGRTLKECERNQIRQVMTFNYTAHYNSVFRILVVVFFYQSILVYPILMGLFYIISIYIFEKIKYTQYCQKPPDLNFEFEMKMLKNLEFTFLVMSIGYFAFIRIISGSFGVYSIILVAITGFDYFILDPKLIHKIISSEEKVSKLKYEEVYLSFSMDYNRQNPLTQQLGFKEWFEQMQLKNKIVKVEEEIKEVITDHKIQIKQIVKPEKQIDNNMLETLFNYIVDKQNKDIRKIDKIDYNAFNIDSLLSQKQSEDELNKINYYQLQDQTDIRKKLYLQKKRLKKKKLDVKYKLKQRPRKFPLERTYTKINLNKNKNKNKKQMKLQKQFTFGRFYQNKKPRHSNQQNLEEEKKLEKKISLQFSNTKNFQRFQTFQKKNNIESIESSDQISDKESQAYFNLSSNENNEMNLEDKNSLIQSENLSKILEEQSLDNYSYESCIPQDIPKIKNTNQKDNKNSNN